MRHGIPLAVFGALAQVAWLRSMFATSPICAFRCATGWPCMTCGYTRAAGWLVRGEWSRIVHECPGAIPLMLLCAAWAAVCVVALIRKVEVSPGPRWNGRGRPWIWGVVALAGWMIWGWIYRLSTGRV